MRKTKPASGGGPRLELRAAGNPLTRIIPQNPAAVNTFGWRDGKRVA